MKTVRAALYDALVAYLADAKALPLSTDPQATLSIPTEGGGFELVPVLFLNLGVRP